MKDRIAYYFALLLMGFFRLLPFHLAVRIGAFLGRLYYRLDRRHRLITLDNLKQSFRETRSEAELTRIALNTYQNLGRSIVEACLLPGMSPLRIKELTDVEGIEHYFAARDQRKGVMFLSAHFGNWEWLGTVLPIYGAVMHVVARPIDNPYLDRLVQGWRSQYGNIILDKRTETGGIIQLLREGATLGFLLDQNVKRKKALFVDYFGRPAATNKGMATIALRTGAPVIPLFIVRKKERHKVIFEKPLTLPRTGSLKKDLMEVTALFTRKIEEYVRRYPDHWFWVHRRWKTRPLEVKGDRGNK